MSGVQAGRHALVVGASGQVGTQLLRVLPSGSAIPTSRRASEPRCAALDLATVSEAQADPLLRRRNDKR
jgi:dTDP-4-dehydrorhamnose reductase